MRLLVLSLVLGSAMPARADDPAAPPERVEWNLEFDHDGGLLGDAQIGLAWERTPVQTTGVLVLRRALPRGSEVAGHPAQAIDRAGPVLIPSFLYPTTPHVYHPAFDARSHAIPPGTQVGEWTVVASVDVDPASPIIDRVESATPYVYALVPMTRADAPDTYATFANAVVTPSIVVTDGWFYKQLWFQLAAGAVVVVVTGFVVWRRRRRRNTAGM